MISFIGQVADTEIHKILKSHHWPSELVDLASSELKWTGRAEFNSDDHFLRQESLRKNGVAILVNERV